MTSDDASFFFFSSRRRHTRCSRDWSSDVCSSDLFPELLDDDVPDDNRPSCSVRMSLASQGLFINDVVVRFASHLLDRKSTRLNSSHGYISYAVFCLKKKIGLTRTISDT